jgi:hypothetical protein
MQIQLIPKIAGLGGTSELGWLVNFRGGTNTAMILFLRLSQMFGTNVHYAVFHSMREIEFPKPLSKQYSKPKSFVSALAGSSLACHAWSVLRSFRIIIIIMEMADMFKQVWQS